MYGKYLKLGLLFLILLLLQLFASSGTLQQLAAYTKPLIVGVLIFMLVSATRLKGRFHRRLLFGMVALLMREIGISAGISGSDSSAYGIVCVIIAYLCFISAFYLDFRSSPELDKKGARVAILVAFVLSFSAYLFLRPHLGIYRMPVMICDFMLSLMMMMAAFRRFRVNHISFLLILSGTAVFALSDFLFAINRFVMPFGAAAYAVDGTQLAALYLIVVGGMERALTPVVDSAT